MVKLGDRVIYKNLNTGAVSEGYLQGEVNDIVGIGNHCLSWVKKSDIKIIRLKRHRMNRFNKYTKEIL